jgi:hypothetical protein
MTTEADERLRAPVNVPSFAHASIAPRNVPAASVFLMDAKTQAGGATAKHARRKVWAALSFLERNDPLNGGGTASM